jgi:hypothetical protein
VTCSACGRYSYLPSADYVDYFFNALGVFAIVLSCNLQSWWPVVLYALSYCARLGWLAFGKRMVGVEASEASLRHLITRVFVGTAVVFIVVVVGVRFAWH